MKDVVALTEDEVRDIVNFIDIALDREWDQYTNQFIVGKDVSCEQGKRRMNPEMYDLMNVLQERLDNA